MNDAMIAETLFDSYAYWRVLARLSTDAPRKEHVQEIARRAGLSAGMASRVLRMLESLGMVEKETSGNLHLYSLRQDFFTKEVRKLVFLAGLHDLRLVDKLLEQNEGIISIAMYGSRAKGDSMAGSDVDLLVIAGPSGRPDLAKLGKKTGLDFNIQLFTPGQFLKMKKDDGTFYNEVIRNHILLHGSELP